MVKNFSIFQKTQLRKWSWLFLAGFFLYLGIEVIFTCITGGMIGFHGKSYFSFAGYSSLWMGLIGGILLISLGALNGISWIKKQNLFVQSLIGAIIIVVTEFIAGCILNLWLHLSIWDYSKIPLNLLGQINVIHFILWFFISPLAFWADDSLRWVFYKTGICTDAQGAYNILWFYKQLFTFKPIDYPVFTGKKKSI